jgi:hypothetical protein
MHGLQQCKFQHFIAPGVIKDNAAFTIVSVDTAGWDYLTIVFQIGATDIAMAALMLKEADADSAHAEIVATDFSDTTQLDIDGAALGLPAADADNTLRVVHLDLRKRKRYINASVTAGDGSAGTYLSALAILSRGEIGPRTSAGQGAGTGGQVVVV